MMQTADPRQAHGSINVAMLGEDLREIALRIWNGQARDYVIRVMLQPPLDEPAEVTPPAAKKPGRRKSAR